MKTYGSQLTLNSGLAVRFSWEVPGSVIRVEILRLKPNEDPEVLDWADMTTGQFARHLADLKEAEANPPWRESPSYPRGLTE
jgi:hypothetical protein